MVANSSCHPNVVCEEKNSLLVDGAHSIPATTNASYAKCAIIGLVVTLVLLATLSACQQRVPLLDRSNLHANALYFEEHEQWLNAMTGARKMADLLKDKLEVVHHAGEQVRAAIKQWAEAKGHKYSKIMTEYLDEMTEASVEIELADSKFRAALHLLHDTFEIVADQLETQLEKVNTKDVSIKEPKEQLSSAIDLALTDFKTLGPKFEKSEKQFSKLANKTDVILAECDGTLAKFRKKENKGITDMWLKSLGGCLGTVSAAGGGAALGSALAPQSMPVVVLGSVGAGIVCACIAVAATVDTHIIMQQMDHFAQAFRTTKKSIKNIGHQCQGLAECAHQDYDNLQQVNSKLKVEKWMIRQTKVSFWKKQVLPYTRKTVEYISNKLKA